MAVKIDQYGDYVIKGFTIDSIIEMAYRFGKQDERFQPGKDNMDESMKMVKDTLSKFDSFMELNKDYTK